MNVEEIRSYRGPSIYSSKHPSIKSRIAVDEQDTVDKDNFLDIVDDLKSEISIHFEDIDSKTETIQLWRLLPSLVAALLADSTGKRPEILMDLHQDGNIVEFVLEMDNERVTTNAVYDSIDILRNFKQRKTPNLSKIVGQLKDDYYKYSLGPSTSSIVDAAEEQDIPFLRLNDYSLVQLGYGNRNRKIEATITDSTSFVGMKIAQSKLVTKKMLKMGGLPVPVGFMVETWLEAERALSEIKGPAVIKPTDASKGRGATTGIASPADAKNAFSEAKRVSDQVLIEEHVKGNDYRVLVVGDRVVAAAERKPASVTGDGTHTVRELIQIENDNPRRGSDHELPLTKITIDSQTKMALSRQDLDLDSIPDDNQTVVLKTTANLSTGGHAIDRTDEIHPVNETIAIRAAKLLEMDICGVDIIAPNVNESWYENGGKIIEINASPGLRMHIFPQEGKPRDPGKHIVSQLFPNGSSPRIPIIPITGTNGKTTVTLLVSHILRLAGYDVGTTTTEGIYGHGSRILKCDCTGPWSAEAVLKDATVDIGVLETARGGILKRGLGFNRADVSALLNVSEEHLGEHGIETVEDMAEVKGLLYEVTKSDGWIVVNCEDNLVWKQAERSQAKEIGFSKSPKSPNVQILQKEGSPYVTVDNGMITIVDRDRSLPIVAAESVPITFEGIADFNIENALAATAIAYTLGVNVETIRAGLLSFAPTPELNPGRSNMLRIGSFNVLVDYAHNKAAIRLISEFLRKLRTRWGLARLTAVMSLPGNRRETEYNDIMEIVAETFDKVYLKEDKDTRGRERGELAQLMENALLGAGMSPDSIHSYSVEPDAIKKALENAIEDELIFVNFESFEQVYSAISEFRESDIRSRGIL